MRIRHKNDKSVYPYDILQTTGNNDSQVPTIRKLTCKKSNFKFDNKNRKHRAPVSLETLA